MKITDNIITFNNVLPDSMFEQIEQFISLPNWGLSVSDNNYQPHKKFWGMYLDKEPFFNKDVFNIIKKITNKNFKINKILANAQASMQDGSPHVDNFSPNAKTFILYANRHWDYQWGGQTIFFDRYEFIDSNNSKNEIINSSETHSLFPIPNTGVMFPSNMVHFAMGPSRDFYEMRYTIAYHLEEI